MRVCVIYVGYVHETKVIDLFCCYGWQDMIVYIARDGVATSDLFRRPGSHTDLKVIVRRLAEGYPVQFSDYNFYTLASVVKVRNFS